MLKSNLFTGDITYEIFMNEYLHKKPCVIGKINGHFKNFITTDNVEDMLSTSGYFHRDDTRIGFTTFKTDELIHDISTLTQSDEGQSFRKYSPLLKAHSVRNFLKKGGGIIIKSVQDINRKVARLQRQFEGTFKKRFNTGLFYNFTGANTLGEHFDCIDIFIVQTEGSKNWVIKKPVVNNATYMYSEKDNLNFGDKYSELYADKSEDYLNITLNAGEVLYIPRGYPHFVTSGDNGSTYLFFDIETETLDEFYAWKSSYEESGLLRQTYDIKSPKDMTEKISNAGKISEEELERYNDYLENKHYSNASEGFIPTKTIEDRIKNKESIIVHYCPIYKARYKVVNNIHIINVNSEEFEIEDDRILTFKLVLNYLYKHRFSDIYNIFDNVEDSTNQDIINVIQDLYDCGLVNLD
jgi:ribosomal protein L16 Arg81 hydroxylase